MTGGLRPSDEADSHDECVRRIYRAANGDSPWSEACSMIATVTGVHAIEIIGIDKRSGSLAFRWEGGNDGDSARSEGVATDRTRDAASRDRALDLATVRERGYLSGIRLIDDDDHLVLLASNDAGTPTPADMARQSPIQRLQPHLCEALRIYLQQRRLDGQWLAVCGILETMPHAIFLLDSARTIQFRNRAADEFCDRNQLVHVDDGRFTLADREDEHRFANAIEQLALVDPSPLAWKADRIVQRVGGVGAPQAAVLIGIAARGGHAAAFGSEPHVIVIAREIHSQIVSDPIVIQHAFSLTVAEAAVAAALVEGMAPEEIARQRGVSMNTVRAQLRAVFDKTGTRRQLELVRMLGSIPVFRPVEQGPMARHSDRADGCQRHLRRPDGKR
ncbi:MAG: LuxR C-terminal-related transcriptional regulator [Burkholderiaceae bacterium]